MKRGSWKGWIRALAVAGLLLAWLGIICRGRDTWVVPAVIYYATPWLLRLLAGVLAVIVVKHWGLRLMAVTCIFVSALEGWHSFRLDEVPPLPASALQAAIYNSGRSLEGTPDAWPVLAETDVTAIVEAGEFTSEKWQDFSAATAGMEWQRFGGTIFGVRGKILSHESLGVEDLYKCYRARISLPRHGEFTVVIADVHSQPWLPREKSMAGILAAGKDDPKVIILGDFNTPPGSVWYKGWHPALSLANDGPRSGFRETWAFGLPLLTLDQIWIGSAWKPVWVDHTRHGSDHSRVRVVLGSAN